MATYLSGPMTGYPAFNFPAFHEAAARLRREGVEVVSPAELTPSTDGAWEDYLRKDIAALLTCDTIYLMPGWEHSKGARLELTIAEALGMRVVVE